MITVAYIIRLIMAQIEDVVKDIPKHMFHNVRDKQTK
jgi:hypothetical protein